MQTRGCFTSWLMQGKRKNISILYNLKVRRWSPKQLNRMQYLITTCSTLGLMSQDIFSINFSEPDWQPRNLDHLELPFTQQEIQEVIMSAPKEKALGPDGFIGLFFSTCWHILKQDLTNALRQFYSMNQQGLQLLNQDYVVLIPKKQEAIRVNDFRPISLIHSFAKILSKFLANRLRPELDHLISIN
jgi:hypothetical protein